MAYRMLPLEIRSWNRLVTPTPHPPLSRDAAGRPQPGRPFPPIGGRPAHLRNFVGETPNRFLNT